MEGKDQAARSPIALSSPLELADLGRAVRAGWRDFVAEPAFGLFFASIFTLVGGLCTYLALARGETVWLIFAAAGFPLLAPFTAVGLYEVSRRREIGQPLGWGVVLGAVRGRGDEQILSMGVILFVAFGFWIIVAHAIFAIFVGDAGLGSDPLAIFQTTAGLAMLAVGSLIGGIMVFAFYTVTVFSLPMLLDRKVDILTAIIASLSAYSASRLVLTLWAVVVLGSLLLAMIPLFLGLLIAIPVFGHATWHLYRRAVPDTLGPSERR